MATGEQSTKAQILCQSLEDDIVSGKLLPGMHLEENSLIARFRCSRTPVREALNLLVATELVVRKPQRGFFVAQVTSEHLIMLFEAMAEMEAVCGRLCAQRMTTQEREAIYSLHTKMQKVVHNGKSAEYASLNVEFHNMIYAGAKNEAIADLSRKIRTRVSPYRRAQFQNLSRLATSYGEHCQLIEALEIANGQKAYTALYDHVMAAQDSALEFLRQYSR